MLSAFLRPTPIGCHCFIPRLRHTMIATTIGSISITVPARKYTTITQACDDGAECGPTSDMSPKTETIAAAQSAPK